MDGNGIDAVPLSTVLGNVASETGRLAEIAQRLDDTLSDVASDGAASTLQDIDQLRQALEVLAQLTAAMATETSAQTECSNMMVSPKDLGADLRPINIRDAFLYGAPPVSVDWRHTAENDFLEL